MVNGADRDATLHDITSSEISIFDTKFAHLLSFNLQFANFLKYAFSYMNSLDLKIFSSFFNLSHVLFHFIFRIRK